MTGAVLEAEMTKEEADANSLAVDLGSFEWEFAGKIVPRFAGFDAPAFVRVVVFDGESLGGAFVVCGVRFPFVGWRVEVAVGADGPDGWRKVVVEVAEADLGDDGGEIDEGTVNHVNGLVEAIGHPLVEAVVKAHHEARDEEFVGLCAEDEAVVVQSEVGDEVVDLLVDVGVGSEEDLDDAVQAFEGVFHVGEVAREDDLLFG